MFAHEMMNIFFVTLRPTDSVQDVAEAMKREQVGIVCICDDAGVPVGVITDRDIVTRACANKLSLEETTIESIMTRNPLTCSLEADIAEVAAPMHQGNMGRVLVVDDLGRVAGVIGLAEIWHHQSPIWAGSVSRHVTGRELRVSPARGPLSTRRYQGPGTTKARNSPSERPLAASKG